MPSQTLSALPTGITLGDTAMGGPQARSAYNVSGAGVKIGILSDSYNVNGGAASAIAAGLLPAAGVTVLQEGPAGSTDEGQAMAEIVHQTAPGAQLYFYTAYHSEQDFANGIAALTAAGCNVIVDDIAYEDEPFFQIAGPIDGAVAQAVAAGVDYFSAAGNDGTQFYQGAFSPVAAPVRGLGTQTVAQFPDGSTTQTVIVPAGLPVTLLLQWAAPYAADNASVLTIDAVGPNGRVLTSYQSGTTPTALLDFPVARTQQSFTISIAETAGTPAPSQFKEVLEGGGTLSGSGVGVGGGTIYGHALVPGVNAVGAVNAANTPAEGGTPVPEPYSSTGPGQLLYALNGTPLAQPRALATPSFLAPDGVATSVIAPFYGTSASAAEAAAVAALMLQADPTLGNTDLTTLLDDSALPAGAASVAGAGLIRANLATGYAATRVISGSVQPVVRGIAQACTIVGSAGAAQMLLAGPAATLLDATASGDTVVAGAGADTVALSGAAGLLFGGSGTLLASALDGSNTVVGGAGAATVVGGTGPLQVWGGTGAQLVFGGSDGGNTLIAGSAGATLVGGGNGDLLMGATAGNLLVAAATGNATLAAGVGQETLIGGAGGADAFVAGTSDALIATEGAQANVQLGIGQATVLMGGGAGTIVAVAGQTKGLEIIAGFDPTRDMLRLAGYGVAAGEAVAGQVTGGGATWLTLLDGTTLAFLGLSHLPAANVVTA